MIVVTLNSLSFYLSVCLLVAWSGHGKGTVGLMTDVVYQSDHLSHMNVFSFFIRLCTHPYLTLALYTNTSKCTYSFLGDSCPSAKSQPNCGITHIWTKLTLAHWRSLVFSRLISACANVTAPSAAIWAISTEIRRICGLMCSSLKARQAHAAILSLVSWQVVACRHLACVQIQR